VAVLAFYRGEQSGERSAAADLQAEEVSLEGFVRHFALRELFPQDLQLRLESLAPAEVRRCDSVCKQCVWRDLSEESSSCLLTLASRSLRTEVSFSRKASFS
jgi:hypothetical protein